MPMPLGFLYLVAIMDWFSRYVVAWQLSNSLDGSFCRTALHQALRSGTPVISNTDQGSQFTAHAFTMLLETAGVQISMDGRGRVFDTMFIERLWRTVKYEHLYLYEHETVAAVRQGLDDYFHFHNTTRPHQSLTYCTPAEVHFACAGTAGYTARTWSGIVGSSPTPVLDTPTPCILFTRASAASTS